MTDLYLGHWHIELSSICTLRCPRCPRNELPESLINKQLDLNFFKTQITEKRIKNIHNILFCGNDGDPIYCKDFLEICQWIKEISPTTGLRIVTNGSYKKTDWWYKLSKILNEYDEITWSIDGWDNESNNLYRINSNWDSIIQGITTFFENNHKTLRVWGIIPFRFNENMLENQKILAKNLGFDHFRITKSSKFGKFIKNYLKDNDDYLQPLNTTLIATDYKYGIEIINFSEKIIPFQSKLIYKEREKSLSENLKNKMCITGHIGVFINSLGEFYPCCWSGTRYDFNSYWLNLAKQKFNLRLKTLDEILQDDFWKTDFLKFNSNICLYKCK